MGGFGIGQSLGVSNLEQLGAVGTDARALAHNLSRVDQVIQHRLVHLRAAKFRPRIWMVSIWKDFSQVWWHMWFVPAIDQWAHASTRVREGWRVREAVQGRRHPRLRDEGENWMVGHD